MKPTLTSMLVAPTQATACTFSRDGSHIVVGYDDGSVRLYHPPEPRVRKAIRGLGTSVSSVLFHTSSEDDVELWITAGRSIYRFVIHLASDRMILSRSDALFLKDIGQDDENVVNQLALSANSAYLACTTDAGDVYALDISSQSGELVKMQTSHSSIAWTTSFIPYRPSELLTGGYDCTLLLHDFKLGTLLARLEIAPGPALASGISSLPPFITSLILSPHGAVAAGTADGRIWVGLGGVKCKSSSDSGKKRKAKRGRKWGGLNEDEGFFVKIGEGMIVGLQFVTPELLLSCTVHGKLALHRLSLNPTLGTSPRQTSNSGADLPPGGLQTFWTGESTCAKVDVLTSAMQSHPDDQGMISTYAVAGLHADKKRGAVELWKLHHSDLRSAGERVEVDEGEDNEKEAGGKKSE